MRPENIQAWAEGVEFGHPPPLQPLFDQFGTLLLNTQKTAPSNQDAEFLSNNDRILNAEREALQRVSRQQKIPLPNTQKTGPTNSDVEAHLNKMRKQNAERQALESAIRQQKKLFPNKGPKDLKPEPGPYKIPRKPVSKSNDTTPRPPQVVLLRNGETKNLQNISDYAERVRDLGYPEALCPLPIMEAAANNTREGDYTDAKTVKEKDDSQNCRQNHTLNTPGYTDGTHYPQLPFLLPETTLPPGEALALKPANPKSAPKATPILQHIVQPSTVYSTSSTDHHLIENEIRRLSVGSNLPRSDAVRKNLESGF